jgi:hypothetical protein
MRPSQTGAAGSGRRRVVVGTETQSAVGAGQTAGEAKWNEMTFWPPPAKPFAVWTAAVIEQARGCLRLPFSLCVRHLIVHAHGLKHGYSPCGYESRDAIWSKLGTSNSWEMSLFS